MPSAILERLALYAPHLKTQPYLPALIYGTAWKKEATADLVYRALTNGFTAVDTAAQPKHYREDLVAAGISRALTEGKIRRSDLYLQTKYTSVQGQDPKNMPYDSTNPITEQVNASVISSLGNFNFSDVVAKNDTQDPYIDALVLHSPMPSAGETLEVWQTLEQYVPGEIRNLGISNCNLFQLMDLWERARIKPAVVQNRFFPSTKYDIGVRKFCQEKGIIYQSFWTLTGNPHLLRSYEVASLAGRLNISPQSALYCLVLGLGNTTVLNGTTNHTRMKEDWDAVKKTQAFATADPARWESCLQRFKRSIGQQSG